MRLNNLDTFCNVVQHHLVKLAEAILKLRPGLMVHCGSLAIECGKQPYLSCLSHPAADHVDLCVRCQIVGHVLSVEADVTKADGEIIAEMDRFEVFGDLSEADAKIWSFVCAQAGPIIANLGE